MNLSNKKHMFESTFFGFLKLLNAISTLKNALINSQYTKLHHLKYVFSQFLFLNAPTAMHDEKKISL